MLKWKCRFEETWCCAFGTIYTAGEESNWGYPWGDNAVG